MLPWRAADQSSTAAVDAARRRLRRQRRTAARQAADSPRCRVRASFADAEAAEDLPQQIVGGELARDAAQGDLREPQLLGEELPARQLARGALQVRARRL